MFARASILLRTAGAASGIARRSFAAEAAAVDGSKLKLNFFLPHDSVKSNDAVVSSFIISRFNSI